MPVGVTYDLFRMNDDYIIDDDDNDDWAFCWEEVEMRPLSMKSVLQYWSWLSDLVQSLFYVDGLNFTSVQYLEILLLYPTHLKSKETSHLK